MRHREAELPFGGSKQSSTPIAVVLAVAGERPLWQRWLLRAVKLWNLALTAEQSSLLWQRCRLGGCAGPPHPSEAAMGTAAGSGAGREGGRGWTSISLSQSAKKRCRALAARGS
jgi:hypothetical protein